MMMSHIIASSQPPPRAKPATAAMIGFRTRGGRYALGPKTLGCVEQLVLEPFVERVQRLRPVEPDESDPIMGFNKDAPGAHDFLGLAGRRFISGRPGKRTSICQSARFV